MAVKLPPETVRFSPASSQSPKRALVHQRAGAAGIGRGLALAMKRRIDEARSQIRA